MLTSITQAFLNLFVEMFLHYKNNYKQQKQKFIFKDSENIKIIKSPVILLLRDTHCQTFCYICFPTFNFPYQPSLVPPVAPYLKEFPDPSSPSSLSLSHPSSVPYAVWPLHAVKVICRGLNKRGLSLCSQEPLQES